MVEPYLTPEWQALAREAALSAEHLAIGVTALGKANYAQKAYYAQAFFALSVGIERAAKLALVVDHALDNDGSFPSEGSIRSHGHDLGRLLQACDAVAERRGLHDPKDRLPHGQIYDGILRVLSDFATNVTRYYNIRLLLTRPGNLNAAEPIGSWFTNVTIPVLEKYYGRSREQRDEARATTMESFMGDWALVRHIAEDGRSLDSVKAAALHRARTKFAAPYTRMHLMQIMRAQAHLLSQLHYDSVRLQAEYVPAFSEFFAIFFNDDRYFRSRRTWSIYGR